MDTRYWEPQAQRHGLSLDEHALRTAVAVATLVDPMDEADARSALRACSELAPVAAQVDRMLQTLYPTSGRWGRLEPDRLGEHLVATTLVGTGILDWVLNLIRLDDGGVESAAPGGVDHLARSLEVLSRACPEYEELAVTVAQAMQAHLESLVETAIADTKDPARYGKPRVSMSDALATLVTVMGARMPAKVLMAISDSMTTGNHLLGGLSLAVGEAIVTTTRPLAATDPEGIGLHAMSLNNYAIRLAEVGRRDEALAPAQQAVEAYRALSTANPAAYTPNLASSLNNYAILLAELGDTDGAARIRTELAELVGDESDHQR